MSRFPPVTARRSALRTNAVISGAAVVVALWLGLTAPANSPVTPPPPVPPVVTTTLVVPRPPAPPVLPGGRR